MARVDFHVHLVDAELNIEDLEWPSEIPLPRWGETFMWKGLPFIVADSAWDYNEHQGRLNICYTFRLELEGDEDEE